MAASHALHGQIKPMITLPTYVIPWYRVSTCTRLMAYFKLFLATMFLLLTAPNAAWSEDGNIDEDNVPAVKSRKRVTSLGKDQGEIGAVDGTNMEIQDTEGSDTRKDENDSGKKQVNPNIDGLILLACLVALIAFIVFLRFVCCSIEQCEEKSKKSSATKEKVEHTEKEIILRGMKYKALV